MWILPWVSYGSKLRVGFFYHWVSKFHCILKYLKCKCLFVGRSLILSHVNATIQGLSTVRACNACDILQKEFHEFQDHNTSCDFMFTCASSWFGASLDIVCLLFIAIVTYSFLLLEDSKLVYFILLLQKVFINLRIVLTILLVKCWVPIVDKLVWP